MSARTSPSASTNARSDNNTVVWASVSALGVLLAGLAMLIALSLIAWALEHPAGATVASAARVGVQAWYLAHGVGLPVSWGTLSVPPLLVTALIAMFFYRSGRSAVRACRLRTPVQIAECVAAMAITYTTVSVLLSSVAYPGPRTMSVVQVALAAAVMSILAPLAGILREGGFGARIVAALPGPSYAYTRGALAALWALGAMSALAVACSLVIGYSETSALTAALAPSGLGGVTVIGLSITFLPNAMLLATALGTGAGFTLGEGSHYSLTQIDREALPTFPLFAALPHSTGVLLWLATLVPIASAVVGALTLTRHLEREHRTPANLIAGAAMTSLLASLGVLGAAMAASGGLGDGRLATVGASPVRLALYYFGVQLVVGLLAAFIATARALTPAAVARRKRALSVIETTADLESVDGDAVEEIEADRSARPIIATKLAMRRLARAGKFAAARATTTDAATEEHDTPTAPSSSLSVVKRAREAQAAKAVDRGARRSDAAEATEPSGSGASPVRPRT